MGQCTTVLISVKCSFFSPSFEGEGVAFCFQWNWRLFALGLTQSKFSLTSYIILPSSDTGKLYFFRTHYLNLIGVISLRLNISLHLGFQTQNYCPLNTTHSGLPLTSGGASPVLDPVKPALSPVPFFVHPAHSYHHVLHHLTLVLTLASHFSLFMALSRFIQTISSVCKGVRLTHIIFILLNFSLATTLISCFF